MSRATIIGGSVAGLLTAAALADSFDEVLIVESDQLPARPGFRQGVPQGNQVHALLAIGVLAMERLLPGLTDELRRAGGVDMDAGCEVAIYEAEGWAGRVRSDAWVISMRRTHLEHVLRERVLGLPGVTLRAGEVVGLLTTGDRVTGVALHGDAELSSDLVIDASGRGSRAPAWLETLGYRRPGEQELRSYVGYATVPVRLPDGAFPEGVPAILSHPNPSNHYGSSVIPVGDGLHLFGALGMMKCYPPTEHDAFLAHLGKASSPLVAELAKVAEFAGEISGYRMPGTRRRLWEKLARRPAGFAVVGDAVMSINPLYGQGMSVAAVEALAVRAAVRDNADRPELADRIQQAIVPVVERVFQLVISIDSRYPEAKLIGIERLPDEMLALAGALSELAVEDAEASRAFRYAVHFFANGEMATESLLGKALQRLSSGRLPAAHDPSTVPGILGTAAPLSPDWLALSGLG
jgi:2-polyprenyl-6-methoxyphenol hydroxylase-like FAD-dependent oxidoreductase